MGLPDGLLRSKLRITSFFRSWMLTDLALIDLSLRLV
ncbi:hypothetical protein HDF16_006158 [Granulicella aggregans]|uniref:Uncharacterized protein n=1 Tax=Granulicella aggregans TaxID=474949 RepID=A0A7W7ZKG3_9BACT|nr:hypothetical protein [Granulicella aggregans]